VKERIPILKIWIHGSWILIKKVFRGALLTVKNPPRRHENGTANRIS
jgi:hypothetical protein